MNFIFSSVLYLTCNVLASTMCYYHLPYLTAATGTSFTVIWGREYCMYRNGADRYYAARYRLAASGEILGTNMIDVENRTYTATSLTARTLYIFEIALVNEVLGASPYTSVSVPTPTPLSCELLVQTNTECLKKIDAYLFYSCSISW